MSDPYNHEEIADLRERAWKEQGILIVSASDCRLCDEEHLAVLEIGQRLYSQGGER